MENLAGKVGVVTGGASGIGKAIAAAMIAEGMNVVLADVEAGRLRATADALGAFAVVADVSKAEDVAALARAAVDRFGVVDVLCNNAGVGPMAPLADLTPGDWQWMLNVNLWGVIHGVTSFLPILHANPQGGHIVNTASMAGLMAVPSLTPYCASKYAVVGLSEAMAIELEAEGGRIGVSILCPGPVRSDLGRSTRNRPAELAGALTDVLLEDSVQFENEPIDWLSAEATADQVIRAIKLKQLYIITHPGMLAPVEGRHRAIEQAFQAESARRAAAERPA
ncbi:SDR family NAD(P)-dependent oxidoreductase [Sphingomonas sp. MMS24-J13]|uniref:SDR family NAD(P)-dependent oxidoreductase n=1 Tax=Sphingomonas sp. MMS24-J13 TaxID=3238686 RepID=UPI00384AD621